MSIHLHDGLRLRDPQLSIYDAIAQLAPVVRSFVDTCKVEIIADGFLKAIDSLKPLETKPQTMIWSVVRKNYDERQIQLGVKHPDHDPLRFSLVFGETTQGILLYPYSGQPRILAHVRQALPNLFEDYGYWDNTDAPKDLPRGQWAQREKAWAELGNEQGLITKLPMWALTSAQSYPFDLSLLVDSQGILDSFHPQSERLQRALVQIAINAMTKDPRVKASLQKSPGDFDLLDHLQRNAQGVARTAMYTATQQNLVEQSLPLPFPSAISRWSQRPASAMNSVTPALRVQVETLAMEAVNNNYGPTKE